MAEMIQFDLVSPERMLASLEVSEVEVPGAEGDFTAMADHQSLVTTLRPGLLKAKGASDTTEYVVTGGFVEVGAAAVSVLAEQALPRAEVTRDTVEAMVAEAEAAAETAHDELKDSAAKRVADTKGLIELLGL